jgi:hypothetical protein
MLGGAVNVPLDLGWNNQVKQSYFEILGLSGMDRDAVILAFQKLAALGVPADPVLAALAADATLPEPHRVLSGILYSRFHRFDPETLRRNLEEENPFLVVESVRLLSRVGGEDGKRAAAAAAAARPGLAPQIQTFLDAWPGREVLSPSVLDQLNAILLEPDIQARKAAVMVLTVHAGRGIQPAFEEILGSGVLDQGLQMFVAASILSWYRDDIEAWKGLCARKRHRYVRYLAMQELARRGEAEREFLRKLGADPSDPLRVNIRQLLAGE